MLPYYSFNCNHNKTVFTTTDVDPVLDTDVAQHPLSPQCLVDSLIFDHTPDITHTPLTSQPINNNPDAFNNTNCNSSSRSSIVNTYIITTDATCFLDTN